MYDVGGDVRTLLSSGNAASSGAFNWLREGVRHADRVTTVSPTYAQEICTPDGGHGLRRALRARGDGVVGILNGVDYTRMESRNRSLSEASLFAGRSVGQGAPPSARCSIG